MWATSAEFIHRRFTVLILEHRQNGFFLGSVLQHTGPSLEIGQSSLLRSSLLCEALTGGKESKAVKYSVLTLVL
jgi:hypothetical protein